MAGGLRRELDIRFMVVDPEVKAGIVRVTGARHSVGGGGGEMVTAAALGTLQT